MIDLTNVDPAVLKAEIEALREHMRRCPVLDAFKYQSYSRDLDLLIDDLLADEPPNPLGMGLYWVAAPFVEDCYFEKGALQPLVKIYGGHRYQTASTFERLLRSLEEAQRHDLIQRLWVSVTRKTRAAFFCERPYRDQGGQERVERFKNDALESYTQAITWMNRIGHAEAAANFAAERDALRDERFPALPAPSESRRLDEALFWELIANTRAKTESTLEQVALLGESLRAFKGADIKRFGALYAKQMKQLYHWNVWALAYAARGGCSDDAFEEFRAWIILQGDPGLVALAIDDPARAAMLVPANPDLPEGPCVSIIQEAYLSRAGAWLELPAIDLDKPKGREWEEDALEQDYPDLARHYASARTS